MSGEKHQIEHSAYVKNVAAIREAGKNLPAGNTISEAPKDILSNLTIPGYADADKQVQQMIEECMQLIVAVSNVMDKIGENDLKVNESAETTLKKAGEG